MKRKVVNIPVSSGVRDELKKFKRKIEEEKGKRLTWDEFFIELLRLGRVGWGTEALSELKFENKGDPNCEHEMDIEKSGVEASGDSYFYVWRCKKCNLEAYQFLGVREFSWKDVVEEVRKNI